MDESTLQSADSTYNGENHFGSASDDAESRDPFAVPDSEMASEVAVSKSVSEEATSGWCRQPMLVALLAVIAGILLDYLCSPATEISLTVAAASLLAWYGYRVRVAEPSQSFFATGLLGLLLLFVGIAGVGATWHHIYWHRFSVAEIGLAASLESKPCCVELRLCSEPQFAAAEGGYLAERDDDVKTCFHARAVRMRDGESWQPALGNVQLVVHADANHLRSGDLIRVCGRLVRPAPPTNPGQYDFSLHYRRQRLLAFVHVYQTESVELLAHSSWATSRWLSSLRRRLNEMLWKNVGPEEAPFASAILLGNRRQMKKSSRDKFVQTGTAHLLAISGLHIGILAGAFLLLLRSPFFARRHCLWATIAFVIFYAWLVEFRPPVTRASILIVLFCFGKMIGERGNAINLLSAAALIVLAINPTDLFSIGPQLSFLAVTTLILGHQWIFGVPETDPLKRLITNTRPWSVRLLTGSGRAVKTAVLVSAVIWLIALPLVANRFHLISYVSLLVNPLLLLPVSLALYFGMGTLVVGWFWSPAARVFGYLCDRNLWMIESIVEMFQAQSWSHDWTAGPSNLSLTCFYLGLLFCVNMAKASRRGLTIVLFSFAWLAIGWWLPAKIESLRSNEAVTCTFVDVGHGTGVLLQLPDGQNWLYDAGSLGAADFGASNIAGVLWHEHVQHLDTVVVSHADVDHFNSLARLADQFSIGRLLISNTMHNSNSTQAQNLIRKFESMGIPVCCIDRGDQWDAGADTQISVLTPIADGFEGNDNTNSIVLVDRQWWAETVAAGRS